MRRNTIRALIAIGAVLALWLTLRSGESETGAGGGSGLERAGADSAADRPDANPLASRLGDAEGLADPPAGASPLAAAPGSSFPSAESFDAEQGSGELPSIEQRSDLSPEGDSGGDAETEAKAGGMPPYPPLAGAQIGGREPEKAPATEVFEPAPDEPDRSDPSAQPAPAAEESEVLSREEIQRRVEKILPDGSMPDDQLALAREAEAKRILERSKIAAGLAN